ncbi:hypothetical protein AA313_de0208530 [Arthrobotrys entomopaga]|nr:hypothetical protein AA313_de0208530 [Arthrobotrys entomopaga]
MSHEENDHEEEQDWFAVKMSEEFKEARITAKFRGYYQAKREGKIEERKGPRTPRYIFAVGDLAQPATLKEVLNLSESELPKILKAKTDEHVIELRDGKPSLTTLRDVSTVLESPTEGFAYKLQSEDHFNKLVEYMGDEYVLDIALIMISDPEFASPEGLDGAYIFVWVGQEESDDW